MTDDKPHTPPFPPPAERTRPAGNLYERIRARVEPLGGVDLELPPREAGREPPQWPEEACEAADDWDGPQAKARQAAQARALREQARAAGLRFEAYLPPRLADWLLAHIERGSFRDPSEAVFVILGEHEELEPHRDLCAEILRRSLQAAMDDPRPSIPAEEVGARFRKLQETPRPEPAVWRRDP